MEYQLLFISLIILSLASTVAWILMMVDAARNERWGWFVVMLVFGLAAIAYFLVEYGSSPPRPRAERVRERPRRPRRR